MYLLNLLTSYVSWKPRPPINQKIPLHQAVQTSSIRVAHELIKNGADINVEDRWGWTPLCNAIYFRKTESICLLLYYGAELEFEKLIRDGGFLDANLLSISNETFREITKILMNYCTVVDDPRIESYCHELVCRHSVIGSFLAGRSWQSDGDLCELFLTIIPKINPTLMLNFETPFLLIYLQSCDFSTSNWLKGLYTILEFPFAAELVQHVVYFSGGSCFSDLILAFKKRNVERHDRTAIIWIWLSLGAAVNVDDISTAIMHFGYNEELEALIYGFDSYKTHHATTVPDIIDILALEGNYNFVYPILSSKYLYSYHDSQQTILKLLTFFTLSKPMKQKVLRKCQRSFTIDWNILFEKFEMFDSCCPSLAELSRNQIRRTIKEDYVIKQPYQYYDIVKSLKIPKRIKDIILFKEPLYNC